MSSADYSATTSYLQTLASRAILGLDNVRGNIVNLSSQGSAHARDVNFQFTVDQPNLGAPPQFSDMFTGIDNTDPEIRRINEDMDEYIAKYFPHLTACLKTIPEEWLCNVISGVKPFGIDSTIFDMVWQRVRDRARAQATSEARSLIANMSARGFSLPNGALVDLTMAMEQKVSDMVSDANRDAMIKDAEIKHELLKFAEEQAIRYKIGLLQAMADMYKTWVLIPNNQVEREKARAMALASYYNAISDYHKVELAFEEMRLKAAGMDADVDLQNVRNDIAAAQVNNSSNIAPLGQAAAAYGDVASGAASAASSLTAQIESL
jgi:hypothetical protein